MKQVEQRRKHNYKIVISYDGTRYQGWQKLGEDKGPVSIQAILTDVLEEVCHEPIRLIGAGRTDRDVHATGQVANFYTATKLEASMLYSWNDALPPDIQIISLEEVPYNFHSRYLATGKQYTYTVYCNKRPDPFHRNFCYTIEGTLDITAMEAAAKELMGVHDFKGFASKMVDGRSTVKNIFRIEIRQQGDVVTFVYEGDGFLYHMLRIITGTLLEVGLHKRSIESIRTILKTGDRSLAGPTIDGKGLTLTKIYYK